MPFAFSPYAACAPASIRVFFAQRTRYNKVQLFCFIVLTPCRLLPWQRDDLFFYFARIAHVE